MDSNVFRIRFSGKCLPGFDEIFVRQTLQNRLGFTPRQVSSVFRGRPVTLKRNMAEQAAKQYESRLRQIGMDVACETEWPTIQDTETPAPMVKAIAKPALRPATPSPVPTVAPAWPEISSTPRQNSRQPTVSLASPSLQGYAGLSSPPPKTPAPIPRLTPQPPLTPPAPLSALPQNVSAPLATSAYAHPLRNMPKRPIPEPTPQPIPNPPAAPESEFLSTIMSDQDRMADHSTDRRDFLSTSFTGRMHGMHYIWLMGITYLLVCLVDVSDVLWRLSSHGSQISQPPSMIRIVLTLILLVQGARLSVLRLHDMDKSGLWAGAYIALYLCIGLFGSTRFANIILQFGMLVLAVPLGDRYPNRFGGRPEAPEDRLGWFDPGRRCHRNFFLSRCVGIINTGLIVTGVCSIAAGVVQEVLHLLGFHTALLAYTLKSVLAPVCVMGLSVFLRMTIARLHDLELRGTWIVPYIGAVWGLYILMMIPQLGIEVVAGVLINLATLIVFVSLCTTSGSPSSNRFGRACKVPPLTDLWKGMITLVGLCSVGILIGFAVFRYSFY